MDKGPVAVTHHYISTGCQEPLGNNMEVRCLCGLGRPGMGGSLQALVKMPKGQVDPNPGC